MVQCATHSIGPTGQRWSLKHDYRVLKGLRDFKQNKNLYDFPKKGDKIEKKLISIVYDLCVILRQ